MKKSMTLKQLMEWEARRRHHNWLVNLGLQETADIIWLQQQWR